MPWAGRRVRPSLHRHTRPGGSHSRNPLPGCRRILRNAPVVGGPDGSEGRRPEPRGSRTAKLCGITRRTTGRSGFIRRAHSPARRQQQHGLRLRPGAFAGGTGRPLWPDRRERPGLRSVVRATCHHRARPHNHPPSEQPANAGPASTAIRRAARKRWTHPQGNLLSAQPPIAAPAPTTIRRAARKRRPHPQGNLPSAQPAIAAPASEAIRHLAAPRQSDRQPDRCDPPENPCAPPQNRPSAPGLHLPHVPRRGWPQASGTPPPAGPCCPDSRRIADLRGHAEARFRRGRGQDLPPACAVSTGKPNLPEPASCRQSLRGSRVEAYFRKDLRWKLRLRYSGGRRPKTAPAPDRRHALGD